MSGKRERQTEENFLLPLSLLKRDLTNATLQKNQTLEELPAWKTPTGHMQRVMLCSECEDIINKAKNVFVL